MICKFHHLMAPFLIALSGMLHASEVDTLRVYQNDESQFQKELNWIHRPCQKPRFEERHVLINPKDSTYYFIYDEKNNLVEEGLYTAAYMIDGQVYSGFLNAKYYTYRSFRRLSHVRYVKDGRNVKTEAYRWGKVKEVKLEQ